jgi:hypothetical protein
VPGFLSNRPNWVPPPPRQKESVAPPPFGSRGETHLLAGGGLGGLNSDEGTDVLVLYYNPFTNTSVADPDPGPGIRDWVPF